LVSLAEAGLVSVAVGLLAVAADHTGIFAVDGFEEGVAATEREMPDSTSWGTATIPLRARGTAMTVAPAPRATMSSTCQ
jgi:hypothetical protein